MLNRRRRTTNIVTFAVHERAAVVQTLLDHVDYEARFTRALVGDHVQNFAQIVQRWSDRCPLPIGTLHMSNHDALPILRRHKRSRRRGEHAAWQMAYEIAEQWCREMPKRC